MTKYNLLSEEVRAVLQKKLAEEHAYFYHGTLDCYLRNIRNSGLDPKSEHKESKYYHPRLEPSHAIRYCCFPPHLAHDAAMTRKSREPVSKAILLRTKASSLLQRSFGLDHSFHDMPVKIEEAIKMTGVLDYEDFMNLMTYSLHILSCYEIIPANELEIYSEDFEKYPKEWSNKFTPLVLMP